MSELHVTDVPGWVHSSLQGEVINGDGVPANELLGSETTPVVIDSSAVEQFPVSEHSLFHVSSNHGRSYEMGPNATRKTIGKLAVWHDDIGNPYTSYSLKGNNFAMGTIMESATAPSGYIPMGLLESDALLRVVRSSRLLREAGISTEWISRVFEPQQLIYKGELVSQAEYKKRILEDTANEKGLEEMVKIAEAIEPMTFFITGRSMEVNDRLADFSYDTTDSAKDRLKHIFKVYNTLHTEDDGFKPLRHDRSGDRTRFFKTIFPTLLGTNLAKLHNIDMVHTFPTLSNVTILGGLIDLDSIRGAPLDMDDAPIGVDHRVKDLTTITDYDHDSLAINRLYQKLGSLGILNNPVISVEARYTLTDAYDRARTKPKTKAEQNIEQLNLSAVNIDLTGSQGWNAYKKLAPKESKEVLNILWDAASEFLTDLWSDESLEKIVSSVIDVRLDQISRSLEDADDRADLSVDLAKNFITHVRRWVTFEGEHVADIAKKAFDSEDATLRLTQFAPDPEIRLRILQSLTRGVAGHVQDEFKEQNGTRALNKALSDAIQKVLVEGFFENLKDSDWQSYATLLVGFEKFVDMPANSFRVVKHKAIYAYLDQDFDEVIKMATRSGLTISMIKYPFEPEGYNIPEKDFTPRNAFTDSSRIALYNITVQEEDYNTAGADIYSPLLKGSYVAWLGEPSVESEKPILALRHSNPAYAQEIIDKYTKR